MQSQKHRAQFLVIFVILKWAFINFEKILIAFVVFWKYYQSSILVSLRNFSINFTFLAFQNSLNCTAPKCTSLRCAALHYSVVHCTMLLCTLRYCTVHSSVLNSTALSVYARLIIYTSCLSIRNSHKQRGDSLPAYCIGDTRLPFICWSLCVRQWLPPLESEILWKGDFTPI